MKINNCPGCLKAGYDTYCDSCIKRLFNGNKVSSILKFTRPEFNKIKREQIDKLSISGIQVKHSLKFEDKELKLTEEQGEYILKPIPSGQFENLEEMPANENLTMQIAKQLYDIKTAENGIIFFNDEEIAYITRRFDVKTDRTKLLQEDFAQIAGKTEETHGKNYKYDFSYEEIAELMKRYLSAYVVEIEKFFRVVVFNYLFSNGDSHLRNFSLFRNDKYGDYLLTPFYDLLNTSIHVPGEKDLALELFKDDFETEAYRAGSKYTKPDFLEFAKRIGMNDKRFEVIYNELLNKTVQVEKLVLNSFLSRNIKELYLAQYLEKLKRLKS
jgi:serine/threonine-protein kinase HipA